MSKLLVLRNFALDPGLDPIPVPGILISRRVHSAKVPEQPSLIVSHNSLENAFKTEQYSFALSSSGRNQCLQSALLPTIQRGSCLIKR
jgi:hypothetical protein